MKIRQIRLDRFLKTPSQRRNGCGQIIETEVVSFQGNSDDSCASTQFLQMQKKQLYDMKEHLERYCDMLPVFGFNSAQCDINLTKSYLLPLPINRREFEPVVGKKSNQYISFEVVDIQILHILNFLVGVTSLDSFPKAYKASQTKRFFPFNWFDHPDKMQNRISSV